MFLFNLSANLFLPDFGPPNINTSNVCICSICMIDMGCIILTTMCVYIYIVDNKYMSSFNQCYFKIKVLFFNSIY